MSAPTEEHMAQIMNRLGASGLLIFAFEKEKFHVTSIAVNERFRKELDRMGDLFGQEIFKMLEGSRMEAQRKANGLGFDPYLDPKFRGPYTPPGG